MFELDEDQRFLTKRDVILASLYNPEVLNPLPYQDFDRFQENIYNERQRIIRRDTKLLGWIVEEFRNGSPYGGGYTRNYFQRHQVGHHIVDNFYLVSVHVCMTNIYFRNQQHSMPQCKPTFLFSGLKFWGQMQFEDKSDMSWWFSHFKQFRQMGQIEMSMEKI